MAKFAPHPSHSILRAIDGHQHSALLISVARKPPPAHATAKKMAKTRAKTRATDACLPGEHKEAQPRELAS